MIIVEVRGKFWSDEQTRRRINLMAIAYEETIQVDGNPVMRLALVTGDVIEIIDSETMLVVNDILQKYRGTYI